MNHKEFFKKFKRVDKVAHVEQLYQAFKSRLAEETNLTLCNCVEMKAKVARPGGWMCPVHGDRTVF